MSWKSEKTVKAAVRKADSIEMRRMALLETVRREGLSFMIFPVLWAIIGTADGTFQRYPVFVYSNLVLSLCFAAFRFLLHRRIEALSASNLRRARQLEFGSISFIACQWGIATATSIVIPGLRDIKSFLMVAATAVISIGTFAFGINRFLRFAVPACGLIPISLALVLTPQVPGHLVLGAVLCLFAAHIAFTAQYVEKDYWAKLHTQFELQTLSTTDALTGLRNRKFFNDRLAVSYSLAERGAQPIAIALVDLDHFKQINDRHGHPAGDRCLQLAAQALAAVVQRNGDVLARYGGEEFIAMLPNTDLAGAEVIAGRLLAAIRAVDLLVDGVKIPVTCSIGVASEIPGRASKSSALIKAADDALYEAKRSGRNRVVSAPASAVVSPAS